MSGVFINYRRGEHNDVVKMLSRRLVTHFGDKQIFLDTSSIRPGVQYRSVLERRLLDCEVVLAVIHKQWLTACNASGTRRLDDEDDWVRHELELALQNDKRIVPILLDDAPEPRAKELPESIRGLADWQAHRIRSSSRNVDIDELISQLDDDVAAIWTPSDALRIRSSRKPGRWLAPLTGVLALLLLFGPPVLAFEAATPTPDEALETLQIAAWSLMLMCAPLVAALSVTVFRSGINSTDRDLSRMPAGWYHNRVAFPLALVALAVPLVINIFLTNGLGILISLLVIALGLLYGGRTMARNEKTEDELRKNWPYRLPAAPQPVVLRQGVALLDDQLKGWTRPLSKEKRERATYMLNALDKGARTMRDAAQRGRWRWLADRPWRIAGYALWVTITVGLVAATAVLMLRTGRTPWHAYLLLASSLLISGALSGGTMDVIYRGHRWQHRTVAAEVIENVGKLRHYPDDLA